ncbi:MFS transporter [Streptomyces regalis]|uniref:MFS transporter n=1 Tax=Streptomyces regalis TaxID=68262 RepID=A0A101J6Y2_9ACTN|nr:MFS transporter [Streptomyces regalis]KUL21346.1 MFS transporter [Streptomyces regalis]
MTDTPVEEERPARRRDAGAFWRYWTGATASGVGDAVTTVALPLVAVEVLKASSFEVSLITAANYAAWILIGLPAGVLVQRLPLRGTQVAMDLLRAAVLLSVPLAAALGELHLAHLVLVALVVGLATVVFDIGNSTFLTSIVSKEELTARNSLTSASSAATQLGGPSLGGVLVQVVGAATSLLVDVASYLVSAFLLQSLPRPDREARPPAGVSMGRLIRDGWRFVAHHPVIGPCVAAATLVNFGCGALMAMTPLFLVRTLDLPVGVVGLLMAAEGAGSLLGAAVTPLLARKLGGARAVLAASSAGALLAALIPLASGGWGMLLFVVGATGFSTGVVVLSIVTRTHRQTVTPAELLPRVMATVRFVSWGAVPVGALTAGLLATAAGPREALWLVSAAGAGAAVTLAASSVRRLRDLV